MRDVLAGAPKAKGVDNSASASAGLPVAVGVFVLDSGGFEAGFENEASDFVAAGFSFAGGFAGADREAGSPNPAGDVEPLVDCGALGVFSATGWAGSDFVSTGGFGSGSGFASSPNPCAMPPQFGAAAFFRSIFRSGVGARLCVAGFDFGASAGFAPSLSASVSHAAGGRLMGGRLSSACSESFIYPIRARFSGRERGGRQSRRCRLQPTVRHFPTVNPEL